MSLRGSDCSVPHSGAVLWLHYKDRKPTNTGIPPSAPQLCQRLLSVEAFLEVPHLSCSLGKGCLFQDSQEMELLSHVTNVCCVLRSDLLCS